MISAQSISSRKGELSQPNFSSTVRARNRVQLFAWGSQNLRPLRSARKAASSAGVSNALW